MKNKQVIGLILAALVLAGAGCAGAVTPAEAPQLPAEESSAAPAVPEAAAPVVEAPADIILDPALAPAAVPRPDLPSATAPAKPVAAPPGEAAVKTFVVVGTNFSFSLREIRVNADDRVRIVFMNAEGFHDWVLDEFSAATKQIAAGKEDTIEFVADRAGTFEYYCSVGQHRAMGMVGKLIVE